VIELLFFLLVPGSFALISWEECCCATPCNDELIASHDY